MEPIRSGFENSKNQLRLFYSKSLFPVLSELEKQRKGLLLFLWSSGFLFILSLIWWLSGRQFMTAVLIFVAGLVSGFLFNNKSREFKSFFKQKVIKKLIEFFAIQNLLHSIRYEAHGKISKSSFQKAKFVTEEIVEFQGEDFFFGSTYDTPFEICELRVKIKSKINGNIKTAFQGHLLRFNPVNKLEGKIWVLPRAEKPNLSKNIKELYRLGATLNEDTPLSKEYLIYQTPDFVTAHFLTESFKMEIKEWNNLGHTFFIYAGGPEILVAIRKTKDILEPNIFTSNKRFDKIQDLYQELIQMFGLIESFEKGV